MGICIKQRVGIEVGTSVAAIVKPSASRNNLVPSDPDHYNSVRVMKVSTGLLVALVAVISAAAVNCQNNNESPTPVGEY